MDHWRRFNGAFTALGWFADRQFTEVAAPFHSKRQGSGAMTPRLLSFWLALLLGSVAIDQSKADDGLAPQNRERSVQTPQLSDIQMESAAPEQQQDLERERFRSGALQRELASARMELEAARTQALEALALAEEQRELVARERAVNAVLQQDVLTLRKDIDALKTEGAQVANPHRELAAAGQELATMRRVAEGLADDLALAQRAFERLRADAVAARDAADASLLETRQTLEEERRKVERLERDLAEALRSIEALEANARVAAIAQTGAMRSRQLAEAGARQAGEALARERERAGSLATDLETARRERDAAKEELTRISEALEKAREQEHEKAIDLARDLVAARKDIDALKGQIERRTSRIENAAKARPTDHARARAEQRKSPRRQKVGAQMRKSKGVRLTTIVLPDELLPTRPPVKGFGQ
jgi:predicted  nucleic acid-binding Zn-ribbon protein